MEKTNNEPQNIPSCETQTKNHKKEKFFSEEGFKMDGSDIIYEVQKMTGKETLFSIIPELVSRSKIELCNRLPLRELILDNSKKYNLDNIHPGDTIKILWQDTNGYELYITKQGEESIYVINVANQTFQLISSTATNSLESNEDREWIYAIEIQWEKGKVLEFQFNSKEKAKKALKLTQHILKTYKENGYTKKLYAKEIPETRWDNDSEIQLYVNNHKFWFDTAVLTESAFKKNFDLDPTRDNNIMEKYADFLNTAIQANAKVAVKEIQTPKQKTQNEVETPQLKKKEQSNTLEIANKKAIEEINTNLKKVNSELEKKWFAPLEINTEYFTWWDSDNQQSVEIPYYTIISWERKWLVPTSRLPESGVVETNIPKLIQTISQVLLQKKNMKDIQPNDVFKTEKWDDIYIINAQEQENYALNVLKGFIESIQKNKAFDSDDPISLVHDRKYD